MRFVTFLLYSLKVNVLNVLVNNQRSHLLDINFLDSLAVHGASACTPDPDMFPDACFANNLTDIPML